MVLQDPLSDKHGDIALIILNERIASKAALDRVWNIASLKVCADGGANRLYDLLKPMTLETNYLPDLLKGDFDSVRPEVKAFYQAQGIKCQQDEDKYSTDLMKCLDFVKEEETRQKRTTYSILFLGGLTGRLDQTMHTLHMLYKLKESRSVVWSISEISVACLLDEGTHKIQIDHSKYGITCGILPVGIKTAHITTHGLEWDVANWETSFSTQLSTSNHLKADLVEITTDQPVIWTMELKPAF